MTMCRRLSPLGPAAAAELAPLQPRPPLTRLGHRRDTTLPPAPVNSGDRRVGRTPGSLVIQSRCVDGRREQGVCLIAKTTDSRSVSLAGPRTAPEPHRHNPEKKIRLTYRRLATPSRMAPASRRAYPAELQRDRPPDQLTDHLNRPEADWGARAYLISTLGIWPAASASSRRGLPISPGRRLPGYGRRRLRAEGGRHGVSCRR
jgi:hypothetical protein